MFISATDQLNNFIKIPSPPERIVSLVPSQTELLFDLGLNKEVIGITKFCIHPTEWFRSKQRIGGTKTVNINLVKKLKPDLIIANKEENVKEQIEQLRQIAPVFVSDIDTLEKALEMIKSIGQLVGKQDTANELVTNIEKAFKQLIPVKQRLQTAYFIWKNPYMAAGGDTFIQDMLNYCGFANIFQNVNRYPEVFVEKCLISNVQQLINNRISSPDSDENNVNPSTVNCQLLLLSSEPYPFKQKHIDELQLQLPDCKILLVDGEMFSWYGSRLLYAAQYFTNLIEQVQE